MDSIIVLVTILAIILLIIFLFRKTVWATIKTFFQICIITCLIIIPSIIFIFLMGPFGIVLGFVVVLFWIRYLIHARKTLAMHVFSTLAAAMRQNLPLAESLEFSAKGQNKKIQKVCRKTASWLTQGYPLSEALRRGFPKCPGDAQATVTAAEPLRQLPQSLTHLVEDWQRSSRDAYRFTPMNPAYVFIVLLFMMTVCLGLMYFVMPSFQSIFADLGTSLPAATRILLNLFQRYKTEFANLYFLLLQGGVLAVYFQFRPRRPDRPYRTSKLADGLKWRLPFWRWLENNRAMGKTVEFLLMALRGGAPLDAAVEEASKLDLNYCFRKNLERWSQCIRRGDDVSRSAIQCGMGAPLAWAFDPAANSGNTLSVLDNLNSFYRGRYNYVVGVAQYAWAPLVVLGLASLVGFVVLAFFLPMVKMIDTVMMTTMP